MSVFVAVGVSLALAVALTGCATAAVPAEPGAPAASAAVPTANQSPSQPVIRIYQVPHFAGAGVMSPTLDSIHAIVEKNPTVFSGDWFSPSNPKAFVVGVALPNDPAVAELEAAGKKLDPAVQALQMVPAKYSLAQLLKMQQEVMGTYMTPPTGDVRGLGPDPINQALLVTILRTDKDPVLQNNPTVIALAAKYGDAIEFDESSGITAVD